MNKESLLTSIELIQTRLKSLQRSLNSISTKNINRSDIRSEVKSVSKEWFEDIESHFVMFGVSQQSKEKYHELFTKLVGLALNITRKKTYQKNIDEILVSFKDDIIIPLMKSTISNQSLTSLIKIPDNLTEQEKEYFNEAIGCAKNNFLRASTVLGWSTAIHRIHRVIEMLGFEEFSKKSEEMKNIPEGRFKRFNKSFHIQSISDLGITVFDNDLLWVIEYWGLIDANQHERLSICFTMRNNSAHPGEAPITEENLVSFYSDLKKIVFDNPKFKIENNIKLT